MSNERNGKGEDGKLLYCSFCGKSQHEVRKLIAGPSVFVCDECVELCNDIIREEMQEKTASGGEKLPKPQEINDVPKRFFLLLSTIITSAWVHSPRRMISSFPRVISC